jgi:hypothetical protein
MKLVNHDGGIEFYNRRTDNNISNASDEEQKTSPIKKTEERTPMTKKSSKSSKSKKSRNPT